MSANRLTRPEGTGVADPFIHYIRSLHFVVPGLERRYWRLFGDLEYDLRSLRVELAVIERSIARARAVLTSGATISPELERSIDRSTRQEEVARYRRLEIFRSRVDHARGFTFNREREIQARTMLADIAGIVLGIGDSAARQRHSVLLRSACEAYASLDLEALLDFHDRVQELPVGERRDQCSEQEQEAWRRQIETLYARHPLRSAHVLDVPSTISRHMRHLRSRIDSAQEQLSRQVLVYLSIVSASQHVN